MWAILDSLMLELAPVPCDREGVLGVREADPRARQREDFLLLLQRVVVSSEQELSHATKVAAVCKLHWHNILTCLLH